MTAGASIEEVSMSAVMAVAVAHKMMFFQLINRML